MVKFNMVCATVFGIAAGLGSNSLVHASTTYAQFQADPAVAGAVLSQDYVRCMSLSGVNTAAKTDCAAREIARVQRRINQSYLAVLDQQSAPDARQFRLEQQSWLRTREFACLNTYEAGRETAGRFANLNSFRSPDYVLQVTKCSLDEAQRRAAWLGSQSKSQS
jgi:uncharacterized protein YecT (DUF1311 family)